MMLKDLAEIQQQLAGAEENMSNLTSASGDQTSVSSHPAPPPAKRKRSLPGNPDPEADVIALSPKSLMATNRYVCEICSKGFQRDQNLQLHRRGHNLPWKLKQRNPNEVVRKKVYVCPEATCVHHDPARALGDLTGIKKHFSRKHGEKKWKCDKCAKRYAVQSDWKAHSKVCGTREYRCDCGTLFSRRDSFITHRAFCDALAEESARAVTAAASQHPGLLFSQQMPAVVDPSQQLGMGGHGGMIQELCLKREQQQFAPSTWLTAQHQQQLEMAGVGSPGMFGSPRLGQEEFIGSSTPDSSAQPTGMTFGAFSSSATPAASSVHMSATALLQKAAQMGATLSRPSSQGQMASAHSSISATNAAAAASNVTTNCPGAGYGLAFEASPFRTNDDRATTDRDAGSDAVYGLAFEAPHFGTESRGRTDRDAGNGGAGARGGNDGMTRDFLGLRAFSHGDILSMAGFDPCMSTSASSASYEQGHSNKLPWHG